MSPDERVSRSSQNGAMMFGGAAEPGKEGKKVLPYEVLPAPKLRSPFELTKTWL